MDERLSLANNFNTNHLTPFSVGSSNLLRPPDLLALQATRLPEQERLVGEQVDGASGADVKGKLGLRKRCCEQGSLAEQTLVPKSADGASRWKKRTHHGMHAKGRSSSRWSAAWNKVKESGWELEG